MRPSTRLITVAFLLFLPVLVLHRALFLGEAFVPADLLGHLSPYKMALSSPSPWNVLRFDGITQFYPWRLEVARSWSAGQVPLWNPYAFAAGGGTPLLANSQSAPFYPLNFLFVLLYKLGVFWYAFGLTTSLHLLIAAVGTFAYLRSLDLSRNASLLGATTFALSAPVITWLALPTFLAVSCWLPVILLLIRRAHQCAGTRTGFLAGIGAGGVGGLLLLGGHLQVALYSLLCVGLYLLWEGHFAVRVQKQVSFIIWLGTSALSFLIAIGLSLSQLLPTLELSRLSARAAAGPPTLETYNAFIGSAFPLRNFITFVVPDFFGHPNRHNGFYWNTNAYTEWAVYIGIVPLLLALFAVFLLAQDVPAWKRTTTVTKNTPVDTPTKGHVPVQSAFFVGLFLLTLLMAMGTPVNLPFFFLVPGFSQLGNPGRVLIITAFALSVLAAMGLDALAKFTEDTSAGTRRRAAFGAVVTVLLLASVGASQAVTFARQQFPQATFAELLTQAPPNFTPAILFLLLGAGLLFFPQRNKQSSSIWTILPLVATLLDLAIWGYGYNPSSPPQHVYPETPGIVWLKQNAKDALLAPINTRWSLYAQQPPTTAVLPPNGLTAYQLHDVAGYDSLFPGAHKEQVKTAGNGLDPSPPENGNMVFVKTVDAALNLGARYIIVAPEIPDLSPTGLTSVYSGADMTIYENPGGKNFDPSTIKPFAYQTFVPGLTGSLLTFAVLLGCVIFARRSKP